LLSAWNLTIGGFDTPLPAGAIWTAARARDIENRLSFEFPAVPNWHSQEGVARVNVEWIRSTAARRILVHWADPRPAWLWSADGGSLLWRNRAARYFGAKIKKWGLRVAPEPVPIKGQVSRLIRLGSPGRSSLSRIQFLAGGRPASTTTTVTPLELANGQTGALIVGVDPIEPEILSQPVEPDTLSGPTLMPQGSAHLLIDPGGAIVDGSNGAIERFAELAHSEDSAVERDGEHVTLTRFKASPQGHRLLLIEGVRELEPSIADVRREEGLAEREGIEAGAFAEPLLPMGLLPVEEATQAPEPPADNDEAREPNGGARLSSLFDRLVDNEALYAELSAADEQFNPPPPAAEELIATAAEPEEPEQPVTAPEPPRGEESGPAPADGPAAHPVEPDVIAAVIEFEDDLMREPSQRMMYRVTGRGFTPAAVEEDVPIEAPAEPPRDVEMVERTSRYNFDELSRILTDRVSSELPVAADEPVEIDPPIEPIRPSPPPPLAVAEGALINIAAETFILNRLPLGIMVFRDQQVLFANRALTDLVGYDSVEGLRAAGLTAIFPSDEAAVAGPVTHLVRRDSTPIPVTARLQSITWQGRPALMLSATPAESRIGHEAAVRGFAEMLAALRDEGFVLADRTGTVTMMSPQARLALGRREEEAAGDPLSALVHPDDGAALRAFLERPARFAETARPSLVVRGRLAGTELLLFAEGQAGIVTGYFGFARQQAKAAAPEAGAEAVDPSMLARVSRGVRRPLNTIIGFADLIRSAAFGTIENHRYLEYARDIRTAGQEIAVLVDEIDDYARLKSGKFALRPAELDLAALLESCVVRVRGQAGAARVLVRSAISERLPHVRADRASLGQAVLNLLASAIDQTPAGGSVILSAQPEDDGSIVINVRDSGAPTVDPGERFVVFRDGVGKDGEALSPVRSSVGLALTRSLVAVNACSLSVDPAGAVGTLFSLVIPADLVAAATS
jgi:signal transduction histidine kinase